MLHYCNVKTLNNVSALGRFEVLIRDLSTDHSLVPGQAESIRIVSMAYTNGLPEIVGVRDSEDEDYTKVIISMILR